MSFSRRWRRLAFGAARGVPRPYEALVGALQHWSPDSLQLPARLVDDSAKAVGYVLWRYPSLSESFIRREVYALRAAGMRVEVFAEKPGVNPFPEDPSFPNGPVSYRGSRDLAVGRRFFMALLRRRPWLAVRLWLFVVRRRTDRPKFWWRDRDTLFEAAWLASTLAPRELGHLHSPWASHASFVTCVAARMLGITYSVQARASEMHRITEGYGAVDRLRLADFLVTNSLYNVRHIQSLFGTHRTPPIHHIRNGVEVQRFPAPRVNHRAVGVELISVGRLVEAKGFRYLLRACHTLRAQGVAVRCRIIGDAQESDSATRVELSFLRRKLELESVVEFTGPKPFAEVLAGLASADIFVLPCVRQRDGSHDITPNSLIEAMAVGLPVISTRSGAIPEIVEDEVSGILVAPGDDRALAEAIARLVGDPVLRSRLGGAARRRVAEQFDIERNVAERVAAFRGSLAPPAP